MNDHSITMMLHFSHFTFFCTRQQQQTLLRIDPCPPDLIKLISCLQIPPWPRSPESAISIQPHLLFPYLLLDLCHLDYYDDLHDLWRYERELAQWNAISFRETLAFFTTYLRAWCDAPSSSSPSSCCVHRLANLSSHHHRRRHPIHPKSSLKTCLK